MPTDIEKSKEENKKEVEEQEKSDPGTTKGPDPQENMEGPISSLMHKVQETFDSPVEDKPDDK